jgi:uric acid transporter
MCIVMMVTAVGIQTLHKVRFRDNKFPKNFQVIFGSSITATVIVVFVLNLVFNHWGAQGESAVQLAVDEGAVVHSTFGESGPSS